ncbi:hypothetical protein [Kribbella sp. VKM Ac-2569]|uniref:hypothetical protein n=1 Tax=Kribbella sp. VKM Ac-2569 TaxID=2512220 RepID=UPI00102B4A73|nr:hypothetical protein [Kribbella sp. VKM Ac-2569]
MRFPGRELLVNVHSLQLRGEPAGDAGFEVETLAPLVVRTGHDARRDVLVTNRTARAEVLISNGELSAAVVDGSGGVVGRFVGPHCLARKGFEVGPQESRSVPVLIGTASVVPELGYGVPPGEWGLVVELDTEGGRLMLASSLRITITP